MRKHKKSHLSDTSSILNSTISVNYSKKNNADPFNLEDRTTYDHRRYETETQANLFNHIYDEVEVLSFNAISVKEKSTFNDCKTVTNKSTKRNIFGNSTKKRLIKNPMVSARSRIPESKKENSSKGDK